MSDYREKTARPASGDIGTPALYTRNDLPGDISGANLNMAQGQLDSAGGIRVTHEGGKTTYSAGKSHIAVAATPTDIATIYGAAAVTVKVTRVEFAFSAGTLAAAAGDLQLVLRSTANTGGTSTTVTGSAHDSSNATSAASVAFYTANPSTLGTAVGVIRATALQPPAATTIDSVIWEFGLRAGAQEVVLRGTGQGLAINGNGSTLGAGTPLGWFSFEWTEEPTTA